MRALNALVRRIALGLNVVSGILLVGMVLLILADVVTRAMFGFSKGAVDLTFRGSVEIVSYGLLYLVLLTFPHSARQAQVVVEMFTERLGRRVNDAVEGVYTLVLGLFAATLAVRFHHAALRMAESGETTQDLSIPMSWIYHGASVAVVVLALRCALLGLELVWAWRERSGHPAADAPAAPLAKENRA